MAEHPNDEEEQRRAQRMKEYFDLYPGAGASGYSLFMEAYSGRQGKSPKTQEYKADRQVTQAEFVVIKKKVLECHGEMVDQIYHVLDLSISDIKQEKKLNFNKALVDWHHSNPGKQLGPMIKVFLATAINLINAKLMIPKDEFHQEVIQIIFFRNIQRMADSIRDVLEMEFPLADALADAIDNFPCLGYAYEPAAEN